MPAHRQSQRRRIRQRARSTPLEAGGKALRRQVGSCHEQAMRRAARPRHGRGRPAMKNPGEHQRRGRPHPFTIHRVPRIPQGCARAAARPPDAVGLAAWRHAVDRIPTIAGAQASPGGASQRPRYRTGPQARRAACRYAPPGGEAAPPASRALPPPSASPDPAGSPPPLPGRGPDHSLAIASVDVSPSM